MGSVYALIMLPAAELLFDAEDRTISLQRQVTLAAALKGYQRRNGRYPDSLDALTPTPLDTLPTDPFTNKPFRYERRREGFLLYSLGPNGRDDGGSDVHGDFVNGEYAPIDWFGEREKPAGPDDIVVRFPIPMLELPIPGDN